MKIVAATKNKGKIEEISTYLGPLGWQVIPQIDMGIDIIVEEDGTTFKENAIKKARTIMQICNQITIADDSGLEVDYLKGEPGIYSARYAGLQATEQDRNRKILQQLNDVPLEKRTARFICAMAIVFPNGKSIVVQEKCEGFINFKLEGNSGFGYDPIFYLPEYKLTMAQLSLEIKNKISHRAKALEHIKKELT